MQLDNRVTYLLPFSNHVVVIIIIIIIIIITIIIIIIIIIVIIIIFHSIFIQDIQFSRASLNGAFTQN